MTRAAAAAASQSPTGELTTDLVTALAAMGVAVGDAQCAKLAAFLALLAKWNRIYNLTAIREPARMLTHHLLDALAVLPHLSPRAGLRVLDVGSGGGIPGIPLAIARPEWRVTLVDASHKKVAFLTQATIELPLPNAEAYATRIEEFAPAAPFDVVISRAFADLATFAATSLRHLADGGLLVAMKGVHPVEELAELPPEIVVVASPALIVPGLGAARHLIIMRRATATGVRAA